jgi:F-box/leucine-rich repeat protein 14
MQPNSASEVVCDDVVLDDVSDVLFFLIIFIIIIVVVIIIIINNECLQWLLYPGHFPRLTTLNLNFCERLTGEGLLPLSQRGCPMLKILHLNKFNFTEGGLQYLSGCYELQELYLQRSYSTDAHPPEADLSRLLGMLTTLNLCSCSTLVFDHRLELPCTYNITKLTALNLSGLAITDTGLDHVSKLTMLQELDLTYCEDIGPNGVFSLSFGCKNLESLSLSSCPCLSPCLSEDMRLQYLVYQVSDNSFHNCRKLQKLRLHHSDVTQFGILALSKQCTQLRSLSLGYSQYIDDQCLLHLSTHCSMLEHLDLFNCNKVTDNGTQHLARGCHGLKSLDLGKCHITRKSLQYLSEGCFLLEYLSLSFCVNISIHDLTIIVNCENMVNKLRIMQDYNTVDCNNMDNITHDPQRQTIEISI